MDIKKISSGVLDPYGTTIASVNKEKTDTLGKDGGANVAERKGDRVSLSPEAKLLVGAQQAVSATPDVRAERVAQLKNAVDNGTYKPDAARIAKNLLAFENSLAKTAENKGE